MNVRQFRISAAKVRQFNIFVTQSTWPFHAALLRYPRSLFSDHHVPSTNRYPASATLMEPNYTIWVDNQVLDTQMWMQQGVDGMWVCCEMHW